MAEEAEKKEIVLNDDPMLNSFFKDHYTEDELKQLSESSNEGPESLQENHTAAKTQEEIDAEAKVAEADKLKQEEAQKAEKEKFSAALDKAIEEKTKGKFKSLNDLDTIPDYKEPEFANEESKTLYEALLSGKKDVVLDYLQKSTADYSKISDIEILVSKYKSEHPYVSDQDAREEVNDMYNLDLKITDSDKDLLSPEELAEKEKKVARAQRVVKRDAEEFRGKLSENKPVLEIPKPVEKQEPVDEQKALEEKGIQIYIDTISAGADALPESIDHTVTIDVADGDNKVSYSTSFKIEGEDKKALADYVRTFVPPMGKEAEYVKDNKVDVQRIASEGIDKLFGKKMYGTLLRESLAKMRKEVVADIKNIDDTPVAIQPKQEMTEEEFRRKAISY